MHAVHIAAPYHAAQCQPASQPTLDVTLGFSEKERKICIHYIFLKGAQFEDGMSLFASTITLI